MRVDVIGIFLKLTAGKDDVRNIAIFRQVVECLAKNQRGGIRAMREKYGLRVTTMTPMVASASMVTSVEARMETDSPLSPPASK
jgi:hypothetical protein